MFAFAGRRKKLVRDSSLTHHITIAISRRATQGQEEGEEHQALW
jgi:hypothetical protein